MSYILDALNKADGERERKRSAVPGLQAQADYGSERDRGGLPWRAIAIGAVVVLAAVVAWLVLGRDEPAGAPPVVAMPAPPAIAPMQAPPAPVMPVQASPAPVAPVQSSTAPVITAPVAAPVAATPAAAATPSMSTAPLAPAPVAARPPAVAPTAKPAVAAASAPARVPARSELPAELRAALPPISVSGAVYAPESSGRMLFVNGGVLREGDTIAEGLTIERIGASTSILVFRGTRFEIRH